MLRIIIAVILLVWLLGFLMSIAGALVHALLVIAAIVFIIDLLLGQRRV